MLRVATGGGEERQVPIFANIPVKGITRIDEAEKCSERARLEERMTDSLRNREAYNKRAKPISLQP